MSGRDRRHFVTSHRSREEETDKLVSRVKDGLYSSKYKPVDYDKLKALTTEKKFIGQEKLMKVKKLQEASKHSKDQHLVKQHHLAWKKESSRLRSQKNQVSAEIDQHIGHNSDSEHLSYLYKELEAYENKLSRDRDKFREGTVTPIYNFSDDMKVWAQEVKIQSFGQDLEDPRQVQDTLSSLKDQQRKVLDRLQHEQIVLEEDLKSGDLPVLSHLPPEKRIQTGIPEEGFDLECPDLDLKASVLQEFIYLDQKYLERVQELETQHSAALESTTGGWSEEDHFVFLYVQDQYTHDIKNRRMLYIDRLRRHLPHMTRAQIVGHEEWWTLYKYFHERRRDLKQDWSRDRRELLDRARVVFLEATTEYQKHSLQQEQQQKQQLLCLHLYDQVREWREKKLEALQLEQELLEARRQDRLEAIHEEEERDRQKRQTEKAQIHQYQDEKRLSKQKQEAADRERLAELKKGLEEQAAYDKERVRYREAEEDKKQEHRKKCLEEQKAAEEEKQKILEKIREQVRPHVESDLMRLWSDTESWQARVYKDDAYININKPLFHVNTFDSKKVTSDPRFRVAEQLHNAGLSQNPYAAQVLSKVQPLQAQRRDMESTLFK